MQAGPYEFNDLGRPAFRIIKYDQTRLRFRQKFHEPILNVLGLVYEARTPAMRAF